MSVNATECSEAHAVVEGRRAVGGAESVITRCWGGYGDCTDVLAMRPAKATLAAAVAAVTAALVAVPVLAHAPCERAAIAADDPCAAIVAEANGDEARFACVRGQKDLWAAWIAPPGNGARDLVLTTVHVDARGTRSTHVDELAGAAAWWPTIAPLSLRAGEDRATVDVVRIGFRPYALATKTF